MEHNFLFPWIGADSVNCAQSGDIKVGELQGATSSMGFTVGHELSFWFHLNFFTQVFLCEPMQWLHCNLSLVFCNLHNRWGQKRGTGFVLGTNFLFKIGPVRKSGPKPGPLSRTYKSYPGPPDRTKIKLIRDSGPLRTKINLVRSGHPWI